MLAQVVCAGTLDTFQIYVWAVRTGRLLDLLAAHEGPVAQLAFSPTQSLLASCSWDHTVRTWDVFRCWRLKLRQCDSSGECTTFAFGCGSLLHAICGGLAAGTGTEARQMRASLACAAGSS